MYSSPARPPVRGHGPSRPTDMIAERDRAAYSRSAAWRAGTAAMVGRSPGSKPAQLHPERGNRCVGEATVVLLACSDRSCSRPATAPSESAGLMFVSPDRTQPPHEPKSLTSANILPSPLPMAL